MPDWWETGILDPARNDSQEDPDADGLANLVEFQNGTHPKNTDTDGDGVSDGDEVNRYGTDPIMADSDMAGRSDGQEIASGGNPLDPTDDSSPPLILTASLALRSGWNLISLPNTPSVKIITTVLQPVRGKYHSVWSYSQGKWLTYSSDYPDYSDFFEMASGVGYWIHMKEPAVLTGSGTVPSKTIALCQGWNLVGYNCSAKQDIEKAMMSIQGKYESVWEYDAGSWRVFNPQYPELSDLLILRPGFGYWIKTTAACQWTLP